MGVGTGWQGNTGSELVAKKGRVECGVGSRQHGKGVRAMLNTETKQGGVGTVRRFAVLAFGG